MLYVFQIGVGHLRLHHPELGQVAARFGFFGAKGRAEAIDLAEGHGGGFVVKLAGLRQIHLLVLEIIHLEQGGGAFAGCRREDRRVHQHEAVGIEVLAHGPDHLVAHLQDRVLLLAAQPEVPMVHQELDAVLFGGDGIRVGFRHALHDFDRLYVHLVAAWGTLLGANLAGDNDRGFLREILDAPRRSLPGSALFTATHCMMPVPSRSSGKTILPDLRRLYSQPQISDGFTGVPAGFGDRGSNHR